MSHKDDMQQQNSFTTGFTVGLFAGAAGYFLFATKQGAQLRRQFVKDWEEAKHHLVDEGVLEHPDISFRGFLKNLVNQAVFHVEEAENYISGHEESKKVSKSPPRKKETGKRFKGV
jgi:gas vesicle protein